MKLLLSILEHPAVFLLGLALGYLAPSNVSTVASNALSALQWLKNKL